MSWFMQQGVEGFQAGGFQPSAPPAQGQSFANQNVAGAAADPFAYTKGSLLTPWEGKFQAPEMGGGYGVPEFVPFEYGNFDYNFRAPEGFHERYNDPGHFRYADFQAPGAFQAPSAADLEKDPGYQARLQAGQRAIEASTAARGVLRSGGTMKALATHGQEVASSEYDKVYGRAAQEYNQRYGQARDIYGTNRNNAAENWDRNVSNDRQGYQIRAGVHKDNANIQLAGQQLGYEVATGTWDRNLGLERQKYEDARSHANAVASAGAANANMAYNRALAEYQMARDEFWTNQDRQYAILDREANRGAGFAMNYGQNAADLALQRGNAAAAGTVGAANAWNGAWSSIGNGAMDAAAIYAGTRQPAAPRPGGVAPPTGGAGSSYTSFYPPSSGIGVGNGTRGIGAGGNYTFG